MRTGEPCDHVAGHAADVQNSLNLPIQFAILPESLQGPADERIDRLEAVAGLYVFITPVVAIEVAAPRS